MTNKIAFRESNILDIIYYNKKNKFIKSINKSPLWQCMINAVLMRVLMYDGNNYVNHVFG